jgi:hypothetical protein
MINYNSIHFLSGKIDQTNASNSDFDYELFIASVLNCGGSMKVGASNPEIFVEGDYMAQTVHQKVIKTEARGRFIDFLIELINKASYDPNSATMYSFKKGLKVKSEKTIEDNENKYILSNGRFAGDKYICASLSLNMYEREYYEIFKV